MTAPRTLGPALALLAAPLLSALAATPLAALDLALPQGAAISAEASTPATRYTLATGPWTPGARSELALEGTRSDTAWRLRANQMTTLQILAPLRDQIAGAGYQILFECQTDACGGFDFRYGLDLLPEPEMHVDLGDFHYLAARRGREHLALMVSRSSESGFVHLTQITAQPIATPTPRDPLQPDTPAAATPAPAPQGALAATLESTGAAALDDLVFESGKTELGPADFDSLRALADYLSTRPEARVALVGHTDATGSLAANIALSKRRAEAVRDRLIRAYGVTASQITAEGAGWLAPRTTNQTEAGRAKNRRVEVVLTSTPS